MHEPSPAAGSTRQMWPGSRGAAQPGQRPPPSRYIALLPARSAVYSNAAMGCCAQKQLLFTHLLLPPLPHAATYCPPNTTPSLASHSPAVATPAASCPGCPLCTAGSAVSSRTSCSCAVLAAYSRFWAARPLSSRCSSTAAASRARAADSGGAVGVLGRSVQQAQHRHTHGLPLAAHPMQWSSIESRMLMYLRRYSNHSNTTCTADR
jgi:hypothetical protein